MKAGQAIARSLSSDKSLVGEYLRRLDSIYRAYRTHRDAFYAAETRWRDRPFWQRRRFRTSTTTFHFRKRCQLAAGG